MRIIGASICALIVVVAAGGAVYACGDGEGESTAAEAGAERQEAGGRQIVVTRENERYLRACSPAKVGRFLERFTTALRERDGKVLREAWGRGFRAMEIEDAAPGGRSIQITSYPEGMRKLRNRRVDLRFDTVVVGQRGRDMLFTGRRLDGPEGGKRFFGKAGLRCRQPIGIEMMGVVTAPPRFFESGEPTCPSPQAPTSPGETMIVCARNDGKP